MCTLKELITEQKKCIDGITDNQTLEAFSLDYCELLYIHNILFNLLIFLLTF